jgi:hypothetical protein
MGAGWGVAWGEGVRTALIAALGLLATAAQAQPVELLPDAIVDPRNSFVNRIDTSTFPGRTLLRLSTATANVGLGRLEIRARAVIDPTHREVVQRIYRSDGSFFERLAGTFSHHPEHDHFHFDDWTRFQLRALEPDGASGTVVAGGAKQSFCLLDLLVHDSSNPGFQRPGHYLICDGVVQGITPGWSDLYNFSLPGQWIDITDVAPGVYWLEAIVDPDDRVLEADETNNAAGRLVAVFPQGIPSDRYEENDSFAAVLAREEAAPDSPNLGRLDARIEIAGLTLDDPFDFFAFRMERTGGPGDFVRIAALHETGDIDLFVYTADLALFGQSRSSGSLEQVSLEGAPPGAYFAVVQRFSGVVPAYALTIDPAGNLPPAIEVLRPGARGVFVERGFEAAAVEWIAEDPDGDETRVTLFLDRDGVLDKETLPITAPGGLSGADGIAYVNTATLGLGAWLVYAEVGDGGAVAGNWAPGPLVVYEKGDLDLDGDVDRADHRAAVRILAGRTPPSERDVVADMDRDGDVDGRDIALLREKSRAQRRHTPGENREADHDDDGERDRGARGPGEDDDRGDDHCRRDCDDRDR